MVSPWARPGRDSKCYRGHEYNGDRRGAGALSGQSSLPRELRDDLETLKRVIIPTPTGAQIPLALVAEITYTRGPPVIKSEDARPNAWIYVDISTSDIGGFVSKAKEVINQQVDIPAGYTLTWSGQFEYMERAAKRLSIVAPATLFIIFLLLYFNFRNVIEPIVVMMSIPFGLIGGNLADLLQRLQHVGRCGGRIHCLGGHGGRDWRTGTELYRHRDGSAQKRE